MISIWVLSSAPVQFWEPELSAESIMLFQIIWPLHNLKQIIIWKEL